MIHWQDSEPAAKTSFFILVAFSDLKQQGCRLKMEEWEYVILNILTVGEIFVVVTDPTIYTLIRHHYF